MAVIMAIMSHHQVIVLAHVFFELFQQSFPVSEYIPPPFIIYLPMMESRTSVICKKVIAILILGPALVSGLKSGNANTVQALWYVLLNLLLVYSLTIYICDERNHYSSFIIVIPGQVWFCNAKNRLYILKTGSISGHENLYV